MYIHIYFALAALALFGRSFHSPIAVNFVPAAWNSLAQMNSLSLAW
jgi:hypothetical protein